MGTRRYQATTAAPSVELDEDKLVRRIGAWVANQAGIVDDASYDAAIDALTDTQLNNLVRRFLKAFIKVMPAGQ